MKIQLITAALLILAAQNAKCKQNPDIPPCYPLPTENQLKWQDMEVYAFLHYSLNTYTDQEWGYGDEDPALFNPTQLDARQWAHTCKLAGMKGIILTAKHHCGFCLWPSQFTDYSVKNSPWKDGKGDIVRELSEACKKEGLRFAVYLSPWDRNHPQYGRDPYLLYFRNQLTELLTNYGDIFEIWFDGANGGDGYYGGARETRTIDRTTYYQWPQTFSLIRQLQPDILIWSDASTRGDLRWVGTEAGYVGETNWSHLNKEGKAPFRQLHYGIEDGELWVPGETNTSIRPGWFYHTSQDTQVKTLQQLVQTYYKSVGRNSTLLLNFPITPEGRIHPLDSIRGQEFAQHITKVFSHNLAKGAHLTATNIRNNDKHYSPKNLLKDNPDTFWATDDTVHSATLTIQLKHPTTINRFLVSEYIPLGQRVRKFTLEAQIDGNWTQLKDQLSADKDGLTTIGHKRIICFPTITTTQLRFTIQSTKAAPLISRIGLYYDPLPL